MTDNAGGFHSLVDEDQPGITMNVVEWTRTLEIIITGRRDGVL
ncbi:MAG: hypothetical protein VX677_09490 [Candidatus Poribacteria bacterium]|nr:hypothetical protein [Candidatus Poribacteria bacterium]